MEKILLSYFKNRQAPLTYYQLDRKLSNDNLYDLIPELGRSLEELRQRGLLSASHENDSDITYYEITQEGLEYLNC